LLYGETPVPADGVRAALRAGALDCLEPGDIDGHPGPGRLESLLDDALERLRDRCQSRSNLDGPRSSQTDPQASVIRDPLTGLYNHAFLQDQIDREIRRASRAGGEVSLILVDVDHFTRTNDRHGHAAGEDLLRQVGELLSGRSMAGEGPFKLRGADLAGRFGGDEFAILLPDTAKRGALVKAAQLKRLVEHFAFAGVGAQTVSIGVASAPRDGKDRAALLEAAGIALGVAKGRGRNCLVAYEEELRTRPGAALAPDDVALFNALDETITQGAFFAHYQPIVDPHAGRIFAFEALCRPSHQAFPGPYHLFTAGERAGRIAELGRAARKVTTAPLKDLPDGTLMFLNLHPLEINHGLLIEARSRLLPFAERTVFEVTESAMVSDTEALRRIVAELRQLGYRIALDDLGAGYSGLTTLTRLQPDFVKLDMGLIRGIKNNSRSARLIRHLLDFTEEEGVLVVAEGVETEEEARTVKELGVNLIQGYYYSKPAPAFPTVSFPQDATDAAKPA